MLEPDLRLRALVHQLLLERTDGLDAPQVAAFVRGWSSALELFERLDLTVPSAPTDVHEALATLLDNIRRAQADVLEDDES